MVFRFIDTREHCTMISYGNRFSQVSHDHIRIQERAIAMGLFSKTQVLLSIILLVCGGLTSCAPTRSQPARETLKKCPSASGIGDRQTHLAKKQILDSADAVARERGYFPEAEARRVYDEENTSWRSIPGLEGHDYQVVTYMSQWHALDGDLAQVTQFGR